MLQHGVLPNSIKVSTAPNKGSRGLTRDIDLAAEGVCSCPVPALSPCMMHYTNHLIAAKSVSCRLSNRQPDGVKQGSCVVEQDMTNSGIIYKRLCLSVDSEASTAMKIDVCNSQSHGSRAGMQFINNQSSGVSDLDCDRTGHSVGEALIKSYTIIDRCQMFHGHQIEAAFPTNPTEHPGQRNLVTQRLASPWATYQACVTCGLNFNAV